MPPDLDAILDLRLRTAPRAPPDAGAARAYLAKAYAPVLAAARRVEALHRAGRLIGLVLVSGPRPSRFGAPEASALVLLEPGADGAIEWAARTLQALAPDFEPRFTISLNAADRALMATLRPLGFGPAKAQLEGEVALALAGGRGRTGARAAAGVEIAAAERGQAAAINALMREVFLTNPAIGWGGPPLSAARQAAIDAAELERLQRRLGAGHAADFVYTRGGRLMGYFSVIVSAQHPLLGPSGGVNILLLPEIRGQGLGRAAYLHLLERMRALGLETLHGLTSNPAVIHIGGQIGRRVSRIVMRRDGPFIAEALLAAL